MSTFVLQDDEHGLVAVEYPRGRRGRKTEVSFPRSREAASRIAARFVFRANERFPGFQEIAEDGRATVTNLVTTDSGRIFGYAYTRPFAQSETGRIYPAGRYLVELVTIGLECIDDAGVVAISYHCEPVRQGGEFRYAAQYRLRPRTLRPVSDDQHRLAG